MADRTYTYAVFRSTPWYPPPPSSQPTTSRSHRRRNSPSRSRSPSPLRVRNRRNRAPSSPDRDGRRNKDRSGARGVGDGQDVLGGFGAAAVAVGLVAAFAGVLKAVKGRNEGKGDEEMRIAEEEEEERGRRRAKRERRRWEEEEEELARERHWKEVERGRYEMPLTGVENGHALGYYPDETRLLEYRPLEGGMGYGQQQQQQQRYGYQYGPEQSTSPGAAPMITNARPARQQQRQGLAENQYWNRSAQ